MFLGGWTGGRVVGGSKASLESQKVQRLDLCLYAPLE